jgi:threonine dehydratase
MRLPVTRTSIRAAYARIQPHIRVTPVLDCPAGVFGLGQPLSLKLELFQHAGSFKPRGAFNTLTSVTMPKAGVAAASGGNHGAA